MSSSFLTARPALPLALVLLLGGCGGMASNRSLESLHQPIVERSTYALDVAAGPDGPPPGERQRLDGWFEALGLRYGDRVTVDDPAGDPATLGAVAEIAGRRGVLVSHGAPVTPGFVAPGTARIVLSRSRAHVPGCPDWSARSDVNLGNAIYPNYGCAVNGNLAAMVANPEHLLKGEEGAGETVVMTASKAIESYRAARPTGEQGLKQVPTQDGAGSP